jgi:hypothetical protein
VPGRSSESRRWNDLVDRSPNSDVYFRPAYAQACQVAGHGRAMALHIRIGTYGFLLPLLRRSFSSPADGNRRVQDAVTPYGYGGILQLSGIESPPARVMRALLQKLKEWSAINALTSCLVRLHPLQNRQPWFTGLRLDSSVVLQRCGTTSAISLAAWDPEAGMLRGMRKGRMTDLRAAWSRLRVTWDSSPGASRSAHLKLFRTIYEQTMERKQASKFYNFPPKYYKTLGGGLGPELGIAVAWSESEPVGAALFFDGRSCAHYHLSGATERGRISKVSTLLIYEGARWARQRGCDYLHLGGGRKENDSLMEFKRSFGGEDYAYLNLTVIADMKRYEALCADRTSPWPYTNVGPAQPTDSGEARAPIKMEESS